MKGMIPEFSDFVAVLALIVSLGAFWTSIQTAKLEQQRFIGESEHIINTQIVEGKVFVGDSANHANIAEISVFLPNEVEPLKSYNVKAGDPWIAPKLEKYFLCYFERNYQNFLERLVQQSNEEYIKYLSTQEIDIQVPMQTAVGVYIRSRSQSRDWKRLGGYRVHVIYHIRHNLADINDYRIIPNFVRKCDVSQRSMKVENVKFIRWIDLKENKSSIAHRLSPELEIPIHNNAGQIEFHFGRALSPSGYAKDD